MDNAKIGRLITKLRKENNLTQLQLADMMNISDKTVSKWEMGAGCPECGNIIVAMTETDIFCCGKKLNPEVLHESYDDEMFLM